MISLQREAKHHPSIHQRPLSRLSDQAHLCSVCWVRQLPQWTPTSLAKNPFSDVMTDARLRLVISRVPRICCGVKRVQASSGHLVKSRLRQCLVHPKHRKIHPSSAHRVNARLRHSLLHLKHRKIHPRPWTFHHGKHLNLILQARRLCRLLLSRVERHSDHHQKMSFVFRRSV